MFIIQFSDSDMQALNTIANKLSKSPLGQAQA